MIELQKYIGEMAEWSIAAVLKTVEGNTSGGSNPSLSAKHLSNRLIIVDNQTVIFYTVVKNRHDFADFRHFRATIMQL